MLSIVMRTDALSVLDRRIALAREKLKTLEELRVALLMPQESVDETNPFTARHYNNEGDALRRVVVEKLGQLGFVLCKREGSRGMWLETQPKKDRVIRFHDVELSPDERYRFKVYISREQLRGTTSFNVVHFQASQLALRAGDVRTFYVFHAAGLAMTFIRTQEELVVVWNALRTSANTHIKGVRLQTKNVKGLHLTFSRNTPEWELENRLSSMLRDEEENEGKEDTGENNR